MLCNPEPIKDLGFIILCPNKNVGGLKSTLGSIRFYAYDRPSVCIVGSDATKSEIDEMKELCPTYKGKNKITSLINAGMRHCKSEWGMFVFAGARITKFLERTISHFVTDPKDIIYPVYEDKHNFIDASLNGVMINKKTFKEIGKWPDNDMEKEGFDEFGMAKLLWSVDAVNAGCTFKGILGMRIM